MYKYDWIEKEKAIFWKLCTSWIARGYKQQPNAPKLTPEIDSMPMMMLGLSRYSNGNGRELAGYFHADHSILSPCLLPTPQLYRVFLDCLTVSRTEQ